MATYLPYFYPFWGLRWPIFLPFSFVLSLLRPLFPFRLFWVFLITFCVASILENLVWIVSLSYDSLIVCFRLSMEHHWKKERSLKLEAQKKHIRESERALQQQSGRSAWFFMCLLHQRIRAGAPNIRAGALTLFTDQSVRSKYQSGRSDTEWFFLLSKCRDFRAGAPILRAGNLALFMEGFIFQKNCRNSRAGASSSEGF